MKQTSLLKTMLLLCALIVGSSAWATDVVVLSENFEDQTGTPTGWAADAKGGGSTSGASTLYNGTDAHGEGSGKAQGKAWKLGTNSNPYGSVTTCALSTLSGDATLTFWARGKGGKAPVIEISGSNCTVTGDGSSTETSSSVVNGTIDGSNYKQFTVNISGGSSTSKITFRHAGPSTAGSYIYIDDIVITMSGASSDPSSNAAFANTTPSINYPATKTYSQAPTTADGYTGTITYSMTANTAGATINAESGLVTVTKGGEVTVKATAAAVPGSFAASEASYTLTVNDTRASAGLAWSSASANVTYGADNVFPTLTNPNGLTVTYSSTNTSAATINKSGEITLKDVTASTTISAIFAGNDDYKEQTVTYELNVTKAPFAKKDGVFDFVGAAGAIPFEDYGSGVTLTSSDYTTGENTWTAGNVTMVTNDGGGSGIRWWEADGTLRFYNKATATFSAPSGYVITKIVTTGANFNNANVGTLSGSTWKGAFNEVQLGVTATRNIEKITVTYMTETQTETVQSYGWASYVTPAAVEFPANTAYVVTDASVSTGLTLEAVTQVPERTPVLLKGAGTKDITVIASASAPATNLLKVSAGYVSAGKYAYVLAKNGAGACFKQWTGDASVLEGRVVLLLDEAVAPARGIFELDNDATAIEAVKAQNAENGEFFDLQGRKVAQPTKGLYIVNGKKVIIK